MRIGLRTDSLPGAEMERLEFGMVRVRIIRVAMLSVTVFGRLAATAHATDNVAGNLINFNNDGAWSWYMDERAIIDPTNDSLLIGSNSQSTVLYPTGRQRGQDEISAYNLASGARTQFQLSSGLSIDDHDAPGLFILPNGKYIAMYSNHGNTAMGDYLSRYRISTNPHDATSWSAEQSFNWQTVTGWNTAPNANNRVSYHNLYFLSADNGGAGRLYDFSRGTHQSANALVFNSGTNTWSWGGQLTTSAVGGYSTGYIKYASNGVDKLYFMSTETHPRNNNNNLWAGYVSDGKTYDMTGKLIDSNLFDNVDTGGTVPDINQFTNVALADGNTLANPNANSAANNPGIHRFWTIDLGLDNNQNPMGLYIARSDTGTTNPGVTTTPIDHRLFYTHWNGTTWQNYPLAKMGDRLYRGTDKSEEDYTGCAALVPGDPNTVYISTPYDPRDASGNTTTPWYEIYKGVTSNGGANWAWSAITQNSTEDNLRPIVPTWDSNHTALVWFRGTYTTAQNIDAAVVGLVDKHVDEQVGLVHYVDATTGDGGNTTLSDGSPVSGWTTSATTGNGGSVLQASSNVSALKTTLTGLSDGSYDLFGYFWADSTNTANDLRLQFGLSTTAMQLYRRNGSQQAESAQFDSPVTLTGGGLSLYRAYLGRVSVSGGSSISAIIDDFATGTTTRAMYDGLGYALVSITGDYNHDGIVDAADYTVWRDTLGQSVYPGTGADGNDNGIVDQGDYDVWTTNFGHSQSGSGVASAGTVPEPATNIMLFIGVITWSAGRRNRNRRPSPLIANEN
jgi:hypothetical protein